MGKVARYAFIAWLWLNKYGAQIKVKFVSLLMERLTKAGRFKSQAEAKGEMQAFSLAVASGNVKTSLSKAVTLFGSHPTVLLRTMWDVAAGGLFVYEVYDVIQSLHDVPDERLLIEGNELLERLHSSGGTQQRSFEEVLADFENYADETSLDEAIDKYRYDPVLGPSIEANLRPSPVCNSASLVDAAREIRIRKDKVQRFCNLTGLSLASGLELFELIQEIRREDFLL